MGKFTDFLAGKRILLEKDSKYNGKVTAVYDIAWGPHIVADNITQSGGVVDMVWKNTFKKIKSYKIAPKNCLILGLGGGSIAKIVKDNYKLAKIVGIDIDEIIVDMGKRFLGLSKIDPEIHIEDAFAFLKKEKRKFDLILVDIYKGRNVPEEFSTQNFIKEVKQRVSENGLAVFNRLYYGEKRLEAVKFLKKLEKEFKTVDPFYPEANIMFICSK